MNQRPWYRTPEWIAALAGALGMVITGGIAIGTSSAQTAQNTKDIANLQQQVQGIPERLGKIEQGLIDLTAFEKRRHGDGDR